MTAPAPYDVVYDPEVIQQIKAIDRRHHSAIRHAIESSLRYQPTMPSRNRTPLRRSTTWPGAWELRCGARNRFRVFYRVSESESRVIVLAIGEKERAILRIGGEEFEL